MRGTPFATVAIIAALLTGAGYLGSRSRSMPSVLDQATDDREAAERIRESARRLCGMKLHRQCLQLLDEAKRFDPRGDDSPEIQDARRAARDGLAATQVPEARDSSKNTDESPSSP